MSLEGGRWGGREGEREEGWEGGREGRDDYYTYYTRMDTTCLYNQLLASASSRIRFLPVHPARSCRAVVAPRGRRTARSSNWAIFLFSDIKFNNIFITTNNYIYLLKSNSIMLQVIVHNKNNSEN